VRKDAGRARTAGQLRGPESSGGSRRDDAPTVATSAGSSERLSAFISPQREFAPGDVALHTIRPQGGLAMPEEGRAVRIGRGAFPVF
jgi:hypothetical protein